MAKRPRQVELLFPTGGLVRRTGYQSQPPYTSPDCSNVRPFDPLETRERGGSRPGLAKSYATQFGGGNPVQALAYVSVVDDDGSRRDVLLVIAEGILSYTNASGTFTSPEVETILIGEGVNNGYFETLGAGGSDVFASWTESAGSGAIEAETDYRNTGAYSCKLTNVTGSATVLQVLTVTAGASCTLSFWTRGDGTNAGRYWVYDMTHSANIIAITETGVTGSTWTKVTVEFDVPSGCTSVKVYLYSPSSAGYCYFDDVRWTHRVSTATAVFSTSKNTLPVVGMLQKFYIADASANDVSGTEGVVTSSVLTDYSVSDWTALGIDTSKDFIVVTSTQLDELDVDRSIDFATSSYIVLEGDEIAEGVVSYVINRGDRSGDSGYCEQKYYLEDSSVTNWLKEGLSIGGVIATDEPEFYEILAIESDRVWLDAAPSGSLEWWGSTDGTNLVSNPSFETAGAGPPACANWSESGTVAQSTTETYVGAYSARLNGSASSYIYQDVTVTAETEYIFTFRINSSGVCYYQVYDNDHTADIVAKTSYSASSWKHVGVGFTTPSGCTSVRLYIYGSNSAVYAYIDAASLIEADCHGTTGLAYSPYVLFDADVSDWTDYGIDTDTDSITYTDSTSPPVSYEVTATGVSSVGILFDADLSGTEPFDWSVSRQDYEGDDGLLTTANSKSRMSVSSIADLEALTLANDDTVTLTRPEKTFTSGVYSISSVAAGGVTIDTSEIPDGSEYLYQIGRKIQVFDPDTGVLSTLEETDGVQPLNCSILANYRGRLTGVYKNTWYMARINDPLDWDYGADDQDTARAVAGGVAEAADVPDPVTAAFSHTDHYFIFGCHNSFWLMRGDPGAGGEIDPISQEVGIVSKDSWCHLDDGTLMFLSRAGIYLYAPGSGYLVPFSEGVLPEEMINVDGESNIVVMCYDFVNRGVHLFSTPTGGTAGDHWWIDWRSEEVKSLWPVSVPNGMQPFSMIAYAADPTEDKRVILGCYDGYLREFDPTATDDDGTTLTSYVKIGPFRMADAGREGILTGLSGILDEDSANVSWAIRVGKTGEAAVDSTTSRASGTWAASWNNPSSARVRGAIGVIYVSSTGQWALERVDLTLSPGGRIR